MSLPYYKRFPRDFLEGTVGLSLEEKGAYAIVIDMIFLRDGRLEDDARFIAGHLGCSVRKWTAIRDLLVSRGKLNRQNGIISNLRADYLLEEQRKYLDKQAENGSKPKKINDLEKPSPKPKANQPEPEEEPEEERISEATPPHPARAEPGDGDDEKTEVEKTPPVRQADIDRIWSQSPRTARERSSRADVAKALKAAVRRGGSIDEIVRAVSRYHLSPQATKDDCRAMRGLHRSIQEDRWRDWTEDASQGATVIHLIKTPEQQAEYDRKMEAYIARLADEQGVAHG